MDAFLFISSLFALRMKARKGLKLGSQNEVNEKSCVSCSNAPKCALHDTVKAYDRHVVVIDNAPEEWSSHLEKAPSSFLHFFSSATKALLGNTVKVKLTAAAIEGYGDSQHAWVYPEGILVRLPSQESKEKDMEDFVGGLHEKELSAEFKNRFLSDKYGQWTFERLVLVCVHGTRDKRCGKAGPVALKAIQQECDRRGLTDSICVAGSSHIGGHKYAATLISYPGGEWFGQVTPKKAGLLVDFIVGKDQSMLALGGELNKCFRGSAGLDW